LASVIGTYPKAKVVGVALNTTLMSQEDAENYIEIVREGDRHSSNRCY
jgi:uncharacterized NAD-dependent epimerase/dehydratase family protein